MSMNTYNILVNFKRTHLRDKATASYIEDPGSNPGFKSRSFTSLFVRCRALEGTLVSLYMWSNDR